VLLVLFLGLLLAVGGLLLAAAITSSTGSMGFVVGLGLALLPVAPVAGAFLWIDRFEPEPTWLLAAVFAWGAVVAALAASIVNTVTAEVIRASGAGEEDALATTAVLVAPLSEESAKGAVIVALALFARREFDGVVDGIVTAGFVGVGFAFTENILYFGRAFLSGAESAGTSGGLFAAGATFVVRGVLSPFAHPLFTVCTGIGVGLAVGSRHTVMRFVAPLAGFGCAVALHATWNLAAVGGVGGFFATYVVLMVPVFLAAFAAAAWLRAREGRLIARRLPAYVHSGWLPAYDVDMLASLRGRRQARAWAGSRAGARGERAMSDYQRAATELAFLRERAERLGPERDFFAREHALLAMVARSRAAFTGTAQPWRS
jgi:RsiW-degrading membrane proteinase PrsW (M82 family)